MTRYMNAPTNDCKPRTFITLPSSFALTLRSVRPSLTIGRMKRSLVSVLIVVTMAGCAVAPKADFTVTDKSIAAPLAGFGGCMNPYLYSFPNDKEISPTAVKDLEAKVKALHPQFVRIFFLQSWWDRDTDSSTAQDHPGMRQSLMKTLRLAQDSGANVLLQLWWDPTHYENPDAVTQKFAQTIGELRQKHGFSCIRYATIQNEPNENPDDVKLKRYPIVYRAFDHALRDLNLRDDVKIIGGDLVGEGQKPWFAMMARDLADVLDGYSIHVYWDYWRIDSMLHEIDSAADIVAKMPARARHPLYITEFGAQGFRDNPQIEPGKAVDGKPLVEDPTYSFEIGIMLQESLKQGYIGFAQWDMYEAWYDRKMGFGVIGSAESGFKLKPAYQLLKFFTQATTAGWQPIKINGEIEDVWVSAVKSPDKSKTSVFVLNRIHGDKQLTIAGLPPHRQLGAQIWNGDHKGNITPLDAVTTNRTEWRRSPSLICP